MNSCRSTGECKCWQAKWGVGRKRVNSSLGEGHLTGKIATSMSQNWKTQQGILKMEWAASRAECECPQNNYYTEGILSSCRALMIRGQGWNPSYITSCETIAKLVNLSVAHFSPLENRDDTKNGMSHRAVRRHWGALRTYLAGGNEQGRTNLTPCWISSLYFNISFHRPCCYNH